MADKIVKDNFLVPEIIRRVHYHQKNKKTESLAKLKEVIDSKKDLLSKLKAQYRQLLSASSKKKLEVKSKNNKRIDVTKGFAQRMHIAMKYHQSCKEMDNYYSLRLDEFERSMRQLDANFTSSIEKYSDDNLKALIKVISEDTSCIRMEINQAKDDLNNLENMPTKLLQKVMPCETVEKEYKKVLKRSEGLHQLTSQLENELAALTGPTGYYGNN